MSKVEIKSVENGPNVVLLDGRVFTAMCRCGATNNQPYCDGTHAKTHFSAGPTEFKVLNQ
jgi:CDGSH-type Zn-finger protein